MRGFVLTDARVATMVHGRRWGAIDRGAVVIDGATIAWVGAEAGLPERYRGWPRQPQGGRWVTPGLIDCHTHLVHAGDRAGEFAQRLEGASYAEIAAAGGGILSTVRATRAADESELVRQSLPRLDALLAEGVTTVEIKSGYGLTTESEVRMLRAARRLGELRDVAVLTTFLGAHAVPPEFSGRADAYIDHLIADTLPAAAGLADAIDAFCETIAFTPEQVRRLFAASDLPRKLHAEQLSDGKGAVMAARMGALSCDHLEHLALDGVQAMAAAGSVAVLLPGAFYTLRESAAPPVGLLRAHGVPIAVASDCNPGSSPLTSILLALNMACTLFRLTPEEALAGVTREAARALGRGDAIGTIESGKRADLCVWNIDDPAELAYRIGLNSLQRRIRGGR